MSDLANRTLIVTGASRGIGEAIARHFGREGAEFAGTNFFLRDNEGRRRAGLPVIDG